MKNILIVEVNPEKLKALSTVIENKSGMCAVHTAQDGIEAVDIINRTPLDLVITSLEIPGVDGFELLTFLASDFPHVKTIIMTSTKSQMVTAKIKELGPAG